MAILTSVTTIGNEPEADLPELVFPAGLPGFPDVRRFALVRWGDGDSPFSLLRSLEDPDLAFVLVPPNLFFPNYAPELDDDTAERLRLHDSEDALVLVMVTVGERAADATANLIAPVVVNRRTREAAQVVLVGSEHDLRTPLVASDPGPAPGTAL